ncbi:RNA methyltransferase [Meridianimarinicoccus roseus]|uniref:RNA methyltransferase n=1 Tax=Meridianimarinicoccus roseus TaxID=2072018 RepID=A0A2V2LH38_9RHOB|nr:RNA methyltransferase [Meridianimarinicoccus roseus]PWR02804.1 RNA methyltransferase [Meridianimarinicoccus roseus]
MTDTAPKFEIFLVAAPGLEAALLDETHAVGFDGAAAVPGGVAFAGGWPDVWRANLVLRGTGRVLARIGAFRAMHLAQLDKRARKFPWGDTLRADVPVKVEVTCRRSRIYHAGAAQQRIETALRDSLGVTIDPENGLALKVRIEDDLCTFSIDTSGEPLHRRGHKLAVGKAPIRETLAALFLRKAGYDGTGPVLDPMCGSGTFVIEAAEIAAGLPPGRDRSFAFERLAGFDERAWQELRAQELAAARPEELTARFFGSDRDAGAIRMSRENAIRAGVGAVAAFLEQPAGRSVPPPGPPGLVIVNPPYGARIGDRKRLRSLYAAFGRTMRDRFPGWRVALVTSEPQLAQATGLPFAPPGAPVPNGGLRVQLFVTGALPGPATGQAGDQDSDPGTKAG